jgi:hypothetical protein
MNRSVIFLMIVVLAPPLAVSAATLQNTDSQEYELQVQESGRPYGSQYRILEHSRVDICFYGCQIIFLRTGQTVSVNPTDSVVITNLVMYVYPAR